MLSLSMDCVPRKYRTLRENLEFYCCSDLLFVDEINERKCRTLRENLSTNIGLVLFLF
jgi:hypothetical protein